jgi:hypothetical protein
MESDKLPGKPDVLLNGGESIFVGQELVGRTLHTPGHSPGSMSYFFGFKDDLSKLDSPSSQEQQPQQHQTQQQRLSNSTLSQNPISSTNPNESYSRPIKTLVLTGDTLFKENVGRTDLWGGSFTQLKDSIQKKLYTLPEDTVVIPGHGPISTISWERRRNWVVVDPELEGEARIISEFGGCGCGEVDCGMDGYDKESYEWESGHAAFHSDDMEQWASSEPAHTCVGCDLLVGFIPKPRNHALDGLEHKVVDHKDCRCRL